MRLLLVDDDEVLVEVLTTHLSEQNYVVDVAQDGELGWQLLQSFSYDLVLLDVMLPRLDGITLCRKLRQQGNAILVMLLTTRDTTTDKLMGLDSGADDYVVKPFDVQELMARIRALLRRGSVATTPILVCGQLRLDPSSREVTYGEHKLQLSRKEYMLLELFLRHQQRVFNRSDIIDLVWGANEDPPREESVKSHIKSIRRKLEAVGAANWLETLYGQGYRINPIYLKSEEASLAAPVLPLLDTQPTDTQPIDTQPAIVWHIKEVSAANTQTKQVKATFAKPLSPDRQQRLSQTIADIRQRTRGITLERVACLERAIAALQDGNLEVGLHQEAVRNAHKLAGSLGTFGYETGSQVAKQIETLLQSPISPAILVQQASPLMAMLRQAIEQFQPDASPPLPQIKIHDLGGTVILAVDDDLQILLLLQALLEPLGVQLICLNEPDHFWETLTSVQPELLILDINMPGTTGIALCEEVRSHSTWFWLPIIFLTVRTEQEIIQQAFFAGADDYVTKPMLSQELAIRVFNRLRRSRSLRQTSTSTDGVEKIDRK